MDDKIDPKKIDAAADFIKSEIVKGETNTLKRARAIGSYLYKEFFGSSPLAFSNRGKNSPSMAALMEHPEIIAIDVSQRTLSYYISIVIQGEKLQGHAEAKRIPMEALDLGYTKQVRLLPAATPSILIQAANEAVEKNLSAPQIKDLVSELNFIETNGPKKRPSQVIKAVRALHKRIQELCVLDFEELEDDDLGWLGLFPPKDAQLLTHLGERAHAEWATRSEATGPRTVMENFAAATPEGVDALLAEVIEDYDMDLGTALRAEALKVVKHLAECLTANARYADPDGLQAWWADFQGVMAQTLWEAKTDAAMGGKRP